MHAMHRLCHAMFMMCKWVDFNRLRRDVYFPSPALAFNRYAQKYIYLPFCSTWVFHIALFRPQDPRCAHFQPEKKRKKEKKKQEKKKTRDFRAQSQQAPGPGRSCVNNHSKRGERERDGGRIFHTLWAQSFHPRRLTD